MITHTASLPLGTALTTPESPHAPCVSVSRRWFIKVNQLEVVCRPWSVDRGLSVCALCVVCECVCFWASPPFVTLPQLHDWTVPWLHPRWDQWWEQLFCTCSLKHFSHFFSFLFYPFDSSFYPHTLFENHYQDWKGISSFNNHWLWFSEFLLPLVDVNAYCNVLYCRYFGQNSVFFSFPLLYNKTVPALTFYIVTCFKSVVATFQFCSRRAVNSLCVCVCTWVDSAWGCLLFCICMQLQ